MSVAFLDVKIENRLLYLRVGFENGTEWFICGDSCLGFLRWEGVCFTKCVILISYCSALINNEVSG